MLSLAAPWWLLALAALPAIWWLHRRGGNRPVVVSAAYLWRDAQATDGARLERRYADPLWLLRAGIVALLVTTLAAPGWRTSSVAITVWVDNSLSMWTREGETSRMALAVDQLLDTLSGEAAFGQLVVRRLGDPRQSLTLKPNEIRSDELVAWLDVPAGALQPPARLDAGTAHWVVTDGADARLNDWLARVAVQRVVRTGTATDNTAVTSLSLRRSLRQPERILGLARIVHFGNAPAERTLRITADDRFLFDETLSVAPGRSLEVTFQVAAGISEVRAELSPADALVIDDDLKLSAIDFEPLPVLVASTCPGVIARRLARHPGLDLTSARPAALSVDCPPPRVTPQPTVGAATLRRLLVRPPEQPATVTGPLRWHEDLGLGTLFLPPEVLRTDLRPIADVDEVTPVLTVDSRPEPLIARLDDGISVRLDLAAPALIDYPGYPALINALLEAAAGRPLLDPLAAVERTPAESRIAPLPQAMASTAAAAASRELSKPLTGWLLLLVLVLLAADLAIVMRRSPVGPSGRLAHD